jgi:hypothetical protein
MGNGIIFSSALRPSKTLCCENFTKLFKMEKVHNPLLEYFDYFDTE